MGTCGFIMGFLEVEPVTLHRKLFKNTASRVNDVSHITLENTLTLRRSAILGMDPMPATDTAALGARRHVMGNREGSVDCPNTCVVNAEDGKILGFNGGLVRIVCNGEGTALHVIESLRRNKSAVLNHASEVEETHVG